jgi:hypothetical protein
MKLIIVWILLFVFNSQAQNIKIENQVVFYRPQISLNNTGNLFLNGLIKKSIINIDTCIIQYSSYRLNKIKSIIVFNDENILKRIDSIDSDVVSDFKQINYKRIEISGQLSYLGKIKISVLNTNNKITYLKIKKYSISADIHIGSAYYNIVCKVNKK